MVIVKIRVMVRVKDKIKVNIRVKVKIKVMVRIKVVVRIRVRIRVKVRIKVMVKGIMKKQVYKIKSKAVAGPAGITCPCCRHGDKSWSEHQYNRDIRRYFKQDIEDQLEDKHYGKEEEEEGG